MWDKFRKSPPFPTNRPPRINWNVFVKFARSCHFLFQSSPAPSLSRRRRITRGKNRVKSLRRTQTTVCKQFLFFFTIIHFPKLLLKVGIYLRPNQSIWVEVANWPQWRENLENVNCSLAFSLDHCALDHQWSNHWRPVREIIGKREVLLKNFTMFTHWFI